jgi:hypothetical protein
MAANRSICVMPRASSVSPLKAVIEIGTSCNRLFALARR